MGEVFIPCLGKAVVLAGWIAANAPHVGEPACVVEPRGTVLMSSNIVPDLWRIDPATGSVERLAIRLVDRADRDVGFTQLERVDTRGLKAKSAIDGTKWRIDLRTRTASLER